VTFRRVLFFSRHFSHNTLLSPLLSLLSLLSSLSLSLCTALHPSAGGGRAHPQGLPDRQVCGQRGARGRTRPPRGCGVQVRSVLCFVVCHFTIFPCLSVQRLNRFCVALLPAQRSAPIVHVTNKLGHPRISHRILSFAGIIRVWFDFHRFSWIAIVFFFFFFLSLSLRCVAQSSLTLTCQAGSDAMLFALRRDGAGQGVSVYSHTHSQTHSAHTHARTRYSWRGSSVDFYN
jgi:hypothetical protein